MSSFTQIIDRILKNVGKADVGEDRSAIFDDLLDLLRVDLPRAGGGAFANGVASLTLGATGSVAEDGVYSFPATLRSLTEFLQLVSSIDGSVTQIDPRLVYTDPDVFYGQYKFGNAQTDADYSQPTAFLLYGRQIHVRPIPKQTAVASPWYGTLALAGTVYVDTSALAEGDECPVTAYEPYLVAMGTAMEAARQGRDDVLSLYSQMAQTRRSEIEAIGMSTLRRVQPAGDF